MWDQESRRGSEHFSTRSVVPYYSVGSKVSERNLGEIPGVCLQRLMGVLSLDTIQPSQNKAFCALAIPMVAYITGMEAKLDVAEEFGQAIVSSPSSPPQDRSGIALLLKWRD